MANTFRNKEGLKNYISVVYEGEKEKYRLEQVISTTRKEIELRNRVDGIRRSYYL